MISWFRRRLLCAIRTEVRHQLLEEPLIYGDPSRVKIARTAVVNNALFNVSSGMITIEDHAFFGHNVALLTGTHDIQQRGQARQAGVPSQGRDIKVCSGAWVSSNATIIGPCVIGKDAVVAAGAVVLSDVDPGTVVGGVPARLLKVIEFLS